MKIVQRVRLRDACFAVEGIAKKFQTKAFRAVIQKFSVKVVFQYSYAIISSDKPRGTVVYLFDAIY